MLVCDFLAFANKKDTAYDRFHINGPYRKVRPRTEEPIKTLGFTTEKTTLSYNKLNNFCGNSAARLFSLVVRVKHNITLEKKRLNVISPAPEIEGERFTKESRRLRLTCDAYFFRRWAIIIP